MKKAIHVFLIFFFILPILSTSLFSETETEFAANAGLFWYDKFSLKPLYWTMGLNMDFFVNEKFGISPELYLVLRNFEFKKSFWAPALMFNYKFDDFRLGVFYTAFLGAGVTKLIRFDKDWDDAELTTDLALKLNVVFSGDKHKSTFFLITSFDNFLKKGHILVGCCYGIYFGK